MKKEVLRIESLKSGNVLKWIQLQVFAGELLHCVFDNVQEKHFFMEIITGKRQADYVRVYYEEEAVLEKQIPIMLEQSTAVISNESSLIDSVSILENLFIIRREVKEQWVQYAQYKSQVLKAFGELGIAMETETFVAGLSIFERVQLEVVKAYLLKKRVLIFTALGNILSDREREQMYGLIARIKEQGMSCILAEPLEDISFAHTDRVMVIRHGRTCVEKEIEECDYTLLYSSLHQDPGPSSEREVLTIESPSQNKFELTEIQGEYLKNISISITVGEIVKVFCADEKSYEQIVAVLRGEQPIKSGSIKRKDKSYHIGGFLRGIRDGIGLLDGNPVTNSLFMDLSVMDNLQMLLSQKVSGMWLRLRYKKSIRLLLREVLNESVYNKKMKELTAAEIQKVAYSRWLLYAPDLLVCIQPFAEGDILAREAARDMIYLLANRKIPILIITNNTQVFQFCRGQELFLKCGKLVSRDEACYC